MSEWGHLQERSAAKREVQQKREFLLDPQQVFIFCTESHFVSKASKMHIECTLRVSQSLPSVLNSKKLTFARSLWGADDHLEDDPYDDESEFEGNESYIEDDDSFIDDDQYERDRDHSSDDSVDGYEEDLHYDDQYEQSFGFDDEDHIQRY